MFTNNVKVLAKPQAKDKNKLPKKNIKKALFVIAIFNSFKISISAIFPCHFDKPLISSLVEKDE